MAILAIGIGVSACHHDAAYDAHSFN